MQPIEKIIEFVSVQLGTKVVLNITLHNQTTNNLGGLIIITFEYIEEASNI